MVTGDEMTSGRVCILINAVSFQAILNMETNHSFENPSEPISLHALLLQSTVDCVVSSSKLLLHTLLFADWVLTVDPPNIYSSFVHFGTSTVKRKKRSAFGRSLWNIYAKSISRTQWKTTPVPQSNNQRWIYWKHILKIMRRIALEFKIAPKTKSIVFANRAVQTQINIMEMEIEFGHQYSVASL